MLIKTGGDIFRAGHLKWPGEMGRVQYVLEYIVIVMLLASNLS